MNKLVYWPRIALARAELEHSLGALQATQLVIVDSLQALLDALPGATGVVMPDAPVEQAKAVARAFADPNCTVRWVHFITSGRNGFDAAGLPPHLAVTGAAGAVAPTVAEHAMGLLLALARGVPEMLRAAARGQWDAATLSGRIDSIEDKRLLIVGLGQIGRELARRVAAFGMRVEAVTRTVRPEDGVDAVYTFDRLDERLPEADAIVLCAPLTPETRHLLNADRLARCKPSAYLVNVARGGLIDHDALAAALAGRRLAGAGLDVTEPEPLPAGHALWQSDRVLISPHVAGIGSAPSRRRVAEQAVAGFHRHLG